MLPGLTSTPRRPGEPDTSTRRPSGSEYRRALARERALLGWAQACLVVVAGAGTMWAYPGFVAGWARGFLGYYAAGLAACFLIVGLVLAARSKSMTVTGQARLRTGAMATVLVAALPAVAAVVCGR